MEKLKVYLLKFVKNIKNCGIIFQKLFVLIYEINSLKILHNNFILIIIKTLTIINIMNLFDVLYVNVLFYRYFVLYIIFVLLNYYMFCNKKTLILINLNIFE